MSSQLPRLISYPLTNKICDMCNGIGEDRTDRIYHCQKCGGKGWKMSIDNINIKIINSIWFSCIGSDKTIGIVVLEDKLTGERKAYIGIANGYDKDTDIEHIIGTGARLHIKTVEEI